MSEMPVIAFDGIKKIYGEGEARVAALAGVSFEIMRGEFVAVMGPSGSGKSTAMNILGCLDNPTEGEYRFMGMDVAALNPQDRALLRRHFIGFVFQGFNLLKRTTALENVELPLIYRGMDATERRERARRALARVGLAERESHTSAELSGGQQQRVAIARALVSDPAVILADEPTGNLDTHRSHEIMKLLSELNERLGITVILVTHEEDIAGYARRHLRFRDGLIESDDGAKAA
ncbi:MAG: ATP-binding cassette domain-containing protein [Alphaproteobacteria bacterium]|nr:ATP-binding cassette domain-containing protein [Alphaproteobacteria bacterium]